MCHAKNGKGHQALEQRRELRPRHGYPPASEKGVRAEHRHTVVEAAGVYRNIRSRVLADRSANAGDVNLDKVDMEPQINTRQAGTEIEVTDAMERAGDSAYLQWSAEAFPYREEHEWDLPARVYRAMEAARRASS